MSKKNLDLKEDIKNFQISLKSQIRSFKKRLIEPGNIQFIPESFFDATDYEIESYIKEANLDENFDYFLSKRNEGGRQSYRKKPMRNPKLMNTNLKPPDSNSEYAQPIKPT